MAYKAILILGIAPILVEKKWFSANVVSAEASVQQGHIEQTETSLGHIINVGTPRIRSGRFRSARLIARAFDKVLSPPMAGAVVAAEKVVGSFYLWIILMAVAQYCVALPKKGQCFIASCDVEAFPRIITGYFA